jgi:hypothetical protein
MTPKGILKTKARTGKSPEEFFQMANKKGLIENGKIVAKYANLLKLPVSDIELVRGHANAIIYYRRIRTNYPKLKKQP